MLSKASRIWLAVGPAMVVPLAASLFYFVIFSENHLVRVIYGATKAFTVIWPAAAVVLILHERLSITTRAIARRLRAIPLGVLVGVAIVAAMFFLMQTALGQMVVNNSESIRNKAQDLGILQHYWSFALFISVLHSLIEEYYWRWFVFGQLINVVSISRAHLLAGIAFAAHHVVIATQLFPLGWALILGGLVAMGGIVFSMMYYRQKTLLGPWACHMVIDLGIMAIGHKVLFGSYIIS